MRGESDAQTGDVDFMAVIFGGDHGRGIFFSLFDPVDLLLVGGMLICRRLRPTPLVFFFWSFCSLAAMLSCYLLRTEDGQPPF